MQEHRILIILGKDKETLLTTVDNVPVENLGYSIDGDKLQLTYNVRQYLNPKTVVERNLFKFVDQDLIQWRRKFFLFGKYKPILKTNEDGQVRTNLFAKYKTTIKGNWTLDVAYADGILTDVLIKQEE